MRIGGFFEDPVHKASLRFCLRTTISALLAFGLTQFWTLPLHGLWAVLTAIVVMQTSIGGSLRATTEYVIGTFGGALYASVLTALIPHTTVLATAGVLVISIAPLAYAAAHNPSFRVAPFTAAIVLLLSGQFGQSPMVSAATRLGEVVLGGAVAIIVSLLVLPERAHGLGRDAAVRALERLADAFPALLEGLLRQIDVPEMFALQDSLGAAVTSFETIMAESAREKLVGLTAQPDTGAFARTLLRLRHDFVIVGRAAVTPLPADFIARLGPLLRAIGEQARTYLRDSAIALTTKRPLPQTSSVDAALDAYAAEVAALRRDGLTRGLSSSEVEQLFAVGFALEQLRANFHDLQRCIDEWRHSRAR